jgi:uncharacterized protein
MQSVVEEIKYKATPILKQAGATRSALFGSYARGDNNADSDVDILVDLPRGTSLFDLAALQIDLEEVLGKKTDIVTYNSLHYLLRDRILAEQIRII